MAGKNVGEYEIIIDMDTSEAEKSLDKVEKNIEKGNTATKAQGGLLATLKSSWVAVTAAITGAVIALKGIISGIKSAVTKAMDFEEVSSKFDVVFKGVESEAGQLVSTLTTLYGLSETTAKTMLSGFQDVLVPLGLTREEATTLSGELSTLAVDLSSFNNVDVETVMSDIQSALVGNYETMKKYGIVLNATTLDEEARARGLGDSLDAVDDAAKAQLMYDLILESSSDAQGDYERTSGSATNQIRQFGENIKDLLVALGDRLLPIVKKITTALNPFIKKFTELVVNGRDLEGTTNDLALSMSTQTEQIATLEASYDTLDESAKNYLDTLKALRLETFKQGISDLTTGFNTLMKDHYKGNATMDEIIAELQTSLISTIPLLDTLGLSMEDLQSMFEQNLLAVTGKNSMSEIGGQFALAWETAKANAEIYLNTISKISDETNKTTTTTVSAISTVEDKLSKFTSALSEIRTEFEFRVNLGQVDFGGKSGSEYLKEWLGLEEVGADFSGWLDTVMGELETGGKDGQFDFIDSEWGAAAEDVLATYKQILEYKASIGEASAEELDDLLLINTALGDTTEYASKYETIIAAVDAGYIDAEAGANMLYQTAMDNFAVITQTNNKIAAGEELTSEELQNYKDAVDENIKIVELQQKENDEAGKLGKKLKEAWSEVTTEDLIGMAETLAGGITDAMESLGMNDALANATGATKEDVGEIIDLTATFAGDLATALATGNPAAIVAAVVSGLKLAVKVFDRVSNTLNAINEDIEEITSNEKLSNSEKLAGLEYERAALVALAARTKRDTKRAEILAQIAELDGLIAGLEADIDQENEDALDTDVAILENKRKIAENNAEMAKTEAEKAAYADEAKAYLEKEIAILKDKIKLADDAAEKAEFLAELSDKQLELYNLENEALKSQAEFIEKINGLLSEQIDLGLLDTQNLADQLQASLTLSAGGLRGVDLASALSGLEFQNTGKSISIGSIVTNVTTNNPEVAKTNVAKNVTDNM